MIMMPHANIKTILVDLDRTLLHTDKTLSAYSVEVLKKCKKNGIRIIVATARPWRTAKQYCEMMGCDGAVVSNGARIFCGNQQTDHALCQKSAVQVLDTLQRHPDLRITLETGEVAYSNQPISDYETILSDDLTGIVKTEGALKILVGLDGEETLAIATKGLPEDLYYSISNGYLLQIMSKSATKWNGIKTVLELWHCTPEETAYFGDDQDDIVPIKMCGLGISVANGIDATKAAADYVSESNNDDGVAKFIAQWLLPGDD